MTTFNFMFPNGATIVDQYSGCVESVEQIIKSVISQYGAKSPAPRLKNGFRHMEVRCSTIEQASAVKLACGQVLHFLVS